MNQWFESSIDFVDPFCGVFTQYHWSFWVFNKFRWSFLDNQVSAMIRVSSCSINFPGIDSGSTPDLSGFLRHWFRLTHDSKCSAHFSIQINSWVKQKAFDSESIHDLTLRYTHVCKGPTIQERPFTLKKKKKNVQETQCRTFRQLTTE